MYRLFMACVASRKADLMGVTHEKALYDVISNLGKYMYGSELHWFIY